MFFQARLDMALLQKDHQDQRQTDLEQQDKN